MKKVFCCILSLTILLLCGGPAAAEDDAAVHRLLYQGHASLRIVTAEGKVIYVDPYAGEGYDLPADLILVTHDHYDHNNTKLVKNRNKDCQVITYKKGLSKGKYQTFDLGWAVIEAVQAGNNPNHSIKKCVGWIISLSGGVTVYVSGDTSTTDQMAELADRGLSYAFFCCDGIYNMDMEEAVACAKLVNARCSIPYHIAPGELFDADRAELFDAPGRLILPAGEEIILE